MVLPSRANRTASRLMLQQDGPGPDWQHGGRLRVEKHRGTLPVPAPPSGQSPSIQHAHTQLTHYRTVIRIVECGNATVLGDDKGERIGHVHRVRQTRLVARASTSDDHL